MKAILAFAFLLIAAQATPAYHLGFADQLGLNNEQMKYAQVCFESFHQVLGDFHNVAHSHTLETVLRSALSLVEDVEHKLKVDCSHYLQIIASTLLRNTRGEIKETASKNWNAYTVEIIHEVGLYFEALKAGNHYEAGKIEAYIFQVLFGVETPKAFNMPEYNHSNYVPLNRTKFIGDLTKSYFETLGIYNNKAVKDNTECSLSQYYFFEYLPYLNYMDRFDSAQKMEVLETLVRHGVSMVESCRDAYAFNIQNIAVPIARAFQYAPLHATLTVLHNFALNLPEFRQYAAQMGVDVYEGKYAKVGEVYADMLIALVKNIYA